MPATSHALQRSLKALTFGVQQKVEAKREQGAYDRLQEREAFYQLPISGTATADPQKAIWSENTVQFETTFPGDPSGERDADFSTPTVRFGSSITSGQPVAITATVRTWVRNEQDDVIGATIAATALALGATSDVDFRGYLHVGFQGWGAPEDSFDDTEGTNPSGDDS